MNAPIQPSDPIAEYEARPPANVTTLTPQQVQAAHLLALGHSYHDVCQNLSVGRTTLYRWRELPEFTAYLNILLRQTADEITLQTTCLLTAALKLIKDKLNDPATPPHEQIRLALRLLHLYSSPSFLKFLNNRSDCPFEINQKQMHDSMRHTGHRPTDSALSHPASHEFYLHKRRNLLELAQDFDLKYPDPANLTITQPQRPATSARTKMEQNGTSKQCSTAIDQALTGIREKIAAAK